MFIKELLALKKDSKNEAYLKKILNVHKRKELSQKRKEAWLQ